MLRAHLVHCLNAPASLPNPAGSGTFWKQPSWVGHDARTPWTLTLLAGTPDSLATRIAVAMADSIGDHRILAWSRLNLGLIASAFGDGEAANTVYVVVMRMGM